MCVTHSSEKKQPSWAKGNHFPSSFTGCLALHWPKKKKKAYLGVNIIVVCVEPPQGSAFQAILLGNGSISHSHVARRCQLLGGTGQKPQLRDKAQSPCISEKNSWSAEAFEMFISNNKKKLYIDIKPSDRNGALMPAIKHQTISLPAFINIILKL